MQELLSHSSEHQEYGAGGSKKFSLPGKTRVKDHLCYVSGKVDDQNLAEETKCSLKA